MGKYIYEGVKDFNLDHIFDCGQCFRWSRQEDGSYTGIAMGKAVNVSLKEVPAGEGSGADGTCGPGEGQPRLESGKFQPRLDLVIDNCSKEDFEKIWRSYLDLDRDYGAIKATLAESDQVMAKAIEGGSGIRILKQDFWEALLSFIISQNNNIPRIKGCIEALTRCCGEKIGTYKGKDHYALPEPETLANMTPDKLAECRLGYRGPYLIKTAQKVLEKGGADAAEKELRNCETFEEVQEALREYPGVGPKVASCTALFGLGFLDAFPIDVWMRRVMHRLYGMDEKDVRSMEDFAKKNFAPYGGIAQQYLFYYIRGLH